MLLRNLNNTKNVRCSFACSMSCMVGVETLFMHSKTVIRKSSLSCDNELSDPVKPQMVKKGHERRVTMTVSQDVCIALTNKSLLQQIAWLRTMPHEAR